MTSTINTNGINATYPTPGVNNNSQGFRDNFTAIKNNLNTAATELTDLQSKVVLKAALTNATLNNDMANTVISNAATRGFRATTYNLGSALSGVLVVNVGLGDVQYGTITANTSLQFTGWAPSGTQSNIELNFTFANANAYISFPTEVSANGTYGVTTLENYANVANVSQVNVPAGVSQVTYILSTLDCGENISIEQINRPRQSTQIIKRTPSPIGFVGDSTGAICTDSGLGLAFATCTSSNGTSELYTCDSTTGFYLDMPVKFTGTVFGGVTAGTTYYIRTIPSATTFSIAASPGTVSGPASAVNLSTTSGTMYVEPISYLYISSGDFTGNIITRTASNTTAVLTTTTVTNTNATGNVLTLTSTANLSVNDPVGFSGSNIQIYVTNTYVTSNYIKVSSTTGMTSGGRIYLTGTLFGGLAANTYYYIRNVDSVNSNITVSSTFGGSNLTVTTASGNANGYYGGPFGNVDANLTYYITYVSGSNIAISETVGGANTALITENGNATLTAITDYTVTLNSTTSISANDPITFTGNVFGGIEENKVYYVTNVSSPNISISLTRYNGVAGQLYPLATANGTMEANIYQGNTIWKRTELSGW